MRFYTNLLLTALIACPLSSAGAFEVNAVNAIADAPKLENRHILVKDCAITSASREIIACTTDTPGAASIFLETETLDRGDLPTALEFCRSAAPSAQCRADVAGVATQIGSSLVLRHAGIYWQAQDMAKPVFEASALLTNRDLPEDRQVIVRNCTIAGATGKFLSCAVSGESAETNLLVNARSLSHTDLDYARKHCSSWTPGGACTAHIAGTVTKIGSYYRLDNAGVFWVNN